MINNTTKRETEILLNELYPFAEKMLDAYLEFHPFGGYIDSSGDMVHVSNDELNKSETGREELKRMIAGLKTIVDKGKVRVCGFAVNVVLPDGTEKGKTTSAIRIFLEHQEGYCADVFYCYLITENSKISVFKNYAQRGTPIFFKK